MLPRALFLPVLVAAVIALVFADSFETEDIDNGNWELVRGNSTCPDEIKIDTEEATFGVKELEAEANDKDSKKPCTGTGKVTLTEDPKSGGDKFQQAIQANKDSDQIQAGAQTGGITCGKLTFPPETYWQFFSPEADFEVNPPAGSAIAAEKKDAVKFSEDKNYLVIGNQCVYKQEGLVEGLAESTGDAASDAKDKVGGAASKAKDKTSKAKDKAKDKASAAKGTTSGSKRKDDDDDDAACFPAHATVEVRSGGLKRMDDLAVGDEVKVGPAQYSRIFMFTHKLAATTNSFVSLSTASGDDIALTSGHFIYANGGLIAASKVVVGDMLHLGDGTESAVAAVSEGKFAGLYNPQTVSGDVVVNGVAASTYTTAVEPRLAHAVLAPFRALSRTFGLEITALESGGGALTGLAPRGQASL